jgi:hypothetical protein
MLPGCAGVIWNSSFYETALAGDAVKMVEGTGAKEVAKYTSIFGFFPLGYNTYAGLISSELRKGNRTYHVVTKNYVVWSQTTGYIQTRE